MPVKLSADVDGLEERAICNDFEQRIAWEAYREAMQRIELSIPIDQTELDLPPVDDVRIRDLAPMMRAAGNGVELAKMRWGFPPGRPGAGPIFNFRSEGRSFQNSHRCLIPASAFFEFTGAKSPKTKHRFTLNDAPFMGIAGLWRDGPDGQPPDFTMLTTSPGDDVKPIHDRQVVVLRPEYWADWLYLTKPEGELLRALPGGSFATTIARAGSGV